MDKKLKNCIEKFSNFKNLDEKNLLILKENIEFFKFERLIHLLVTIFVGILAVIFFAIFYFSGDFLVLCLVIVVLILEFFYILHYYKLENGTQKLCEIYLNFINLS